MKIFSNKKTRSRNLALVIAPFIILIFVFGFIGIKSVKTMINGSTGTTDVVNTNDIMYQMDYRIRNNPTELQKEIYNQLKEELNNPENERDENMIITLIAESFVADFYTWSNKSGSYDVGGMYYIYSSNKQNVYNKARDTFYKYVTYYIEEYGSENLLEVDSIVASDAHKTDPYSYDGVTYNDTWHVRLDWTYKENKKFSPDKYVNYADFDIFKNADGRYEIYQTVGAY